eukprot:TRINITY_DN4493_c0_g1_i7.p2 TRINITY_DN4493_c0_g1~~TRINITY_DN4493_c0_g1_i7.p2  ORF type:complete len:107 (-),score=13.58 TRINITY_DN4493_c0_g1_i7:11-331(-)
MLLRLALIAYELPHQIAHHLGCRTVQRLGGGHELVAQLGLELHREYGFLGHGTPCTDQVYTSSLSQQTLPQAFLDPSALSGRSSSLEIGRAVQQECRDRSRMPSSA